MQLKFKCLSIFLLLSLFLCSNVSFAVSNGNEYLFPDNSKKQFKVDSATNFYKNNKIKNYQEFDNAKINIREKALYEETYKIVEKELKDYNHLVWQYKKNKHPNISPKRQVYFFYTLTNAGKGKYQTKLAIVDAETKKVLITENHVEY
jgi:hypothetical protein